MADYTDLTQDDAQQILTHYDLPNLVKISAMAGGQANSSFKLNCGSGTYILSVCDEKSQDDLKNLVQLLIYLNENKFPTNKPVLTKGKEPYVIYKEKPVYVKVFMDGQVTSELSLDMTYQVGRLMAKLHQISPPDFVHENFPYGKESFKPVIESDIDHPFIPWLKEKNDFIESHINKKSETGLIHGDIYWDNLLFDKDRLKAVLDFEEACKYYLLYDIAMACVGCCSIHGRFDGPKIKSFLSGYQSIRKLSATHKKQLNGFAVYAATAGAFWRFQQYNLKFPGHEKAESYSELAGLADQAYEIDWEELVKQ